MAGPMIPQAQRIVKNTAHRLFLLEKLGTLRTLAEDEWGELIFYWHVNAEETAALKTALKAVRVQHDGDEDGSALTGHGAWLFAVYTAAPLTPQMCRGGSPYHARVLEAMGQDFQPPSILDEVEGLPQALSALEADHPQSVHGLIENIAVDETFEWMGRSMFESEQTEMMPD